MDVRVVCGLSATMATFWPIRAFSSVDFPAFGRPTIQPFILVNPNASDLLIERRWPKEYFVEAINRLADRGNNIVLMGTRPEAAYVSSLLEGVSAGLRKRVFNTAGMLTLGELHVRFHGACARSLFS